MDNKEKIDLEKDNKKEENLTETNLENKENNGDNPQNTEEKVKDNRDFGEKAEDFMDDVMGNVQDFFYGEGDDYANDIPATMEMPNGIRKVNKVQTRRNFNKMLFGKKGGLIFLALFAIMLLIGFIVSKVG